MLVPEVATCAPKLDITVFPGSSRRLRRIHVAPLLAKVCRALYAVVPNLDRLDYRVEASWNASIDWREVLSSTATGGAWTVLFITIASLVFARRAFR